MERSKSSFVLRPGDRLLMLLDGGAVFNIQGGYHVNELLDAWINGHRSVVSILLRAVADVNGEYAPSIIVEVPFTRAILAYWVNSLPSLTPKFQKSYIRQPACPLFNRITPGAPHLDFGRRYCHIPF
jgi:hypothetical protein